MYASSRVTEDEAMRPFLWRFWTLAPENGRIAVFDRSWYRKVREDRFEGRTAKKELAEAFRDICSFEMCIRDSVKIEHNVDPRDFFAPGWGNIVCEVPDGMVGQLAITYTVIGLSLIHI